MSIKLIINIIFKECIVHSVKGFFIQYIYCIHCIYSNGMSIAGL